MQINTTWALVSPEVVQQSAKSTIGAGGLMSGGNVQYTLLNKKSVFITLQAKKTHKIEKWL